MSGQKTVAQFLKLRSYGCKSIVDQCLQARYSPEAMNLSDLTYQANKVHRGQQIINKLMEDLEPASPIKPSEVAVQMKMPKRVRVVSQKAKGAAAMSAGGLPQIKRKQSSKPDPKFAGTELNERLLHEIVQRKLSQLKDIGDSQRYKMLGKISPRAQYIMHRHGCKYSKFFSKSMIKAEKTRRAEV